MPVTEIRQLSSENQSKMCLCGALSEQQLIVMSVTKGGLSFSE